MQNVVKMEGDAVGKLFRVIQPVYGFLPNGNYIKFRRGDLLLLFEIITSYDNQCIEADFQLRFLTQQGYVASMEIKANSYHDACMILIGFMQREDCTL